MSEDTSTTRVVDIQQPVLIKSREREETEQLASKKSPRKRYRKDPYFSDEEVLDDSD